jgi:cell division protein FtsZ
METALMGINDIKDKVDTLIVIPNQKLFDLSEKNISFLDALKKVDDVLAQAVKSISQLITQTGMINLDFADIKSIMSNAGTALMGIGTGTGDHRAEQAIKNAINSPLLEFSIKGATGVIFNIVGGKDLSIQEVGEAANIIQEEVSPDCNIAFGASIDPELDDEIQITIIATGFDISQATQAAQTGVASYKTNIPKAVSKVAQTYSDPMMEQVMDDDQSSNPVKEYAQRTEPKSPSKSGKEFEDDDDLDATPAYLRRPPKSY